MIRVSAECHSGVKLFFIVCRSRPCRSVNAVSIRFIAVTQPIRYAKQKGSRRAFLALIPLTWVVSLAVSSPIAFGMNYTDQRSLTPTLCTFYNSDFLIGSSMASFYIPCLVMLILYCKMFRSIRQMARRYRPYLQLVK